MISLIKMSVILCVFFLLLSINVNKRPLFSHIYDFVSPATKQVQNNTESFLSKSFDNTHSYTKKIFDNSVPKMKDSVKSKLSSQGRIGKPAEKITREEKEELDQLIKNH